MAPPPSLSAAVPPGRRREARLRTGLQARVIIRDGTISAILTDLSQWGARIAFSGGRIVAGQDAVLSWARFESFGKVIWSAPGHAGLAFDEPLGRAALLATRSLEDGRELPADEQILREAARSFVQGRRRV